MSAQFDLVIDNLRLATMTAGPNPYGHIDDGVLAIQGSQIVYAGPAAEFSGKGKEHIDGQRQWALPGFIDCHTHLVYGGNRANEFEKRLQGVSYAEIAQQGGGIKSTVAATRAATDEQLLASALSRAEKLVAEGVTCIEIKSGYGLDLETEIRMLKIAKQLENHLPVRVETTYLGAHAVPPEFAGRDQDYIDFVCQQVMPQIAQLKLASAVDVFCESIGFSVDQCEQVYRTAHQLGLKIKGHVEQLSDLKGAVKACQYHALSVDHIEYLQSEDVSALKAADTVAVLLPGAFYYLNETQLPPIDALRQQGVTMAVATDLNPGTSPLASILAAVNMACVLFRLTPEEAIAGITRHAAKALGLPRKGQLATGFDADFSLWSIDHPAQLAHELNTHRPSQVWQGGQRVR